MFPIHILTIKIIGKTVNDFLALKLFVTMISTKKYIRSTEVTKGNKGNKINV